MLYEPVIGLEVHAQLDTETKIFCSCSTEFGSSPNTNTCPVCTAMPGVLPVLNKKAVSFAISAGLATNCTIAKESRFDRKNYFYPDLPKGYQITQYAAPIAEHGFLNIETEKTGVKKIGITRIHMEEDAGKLIHDASRGRSMVDLNRAGVPLIEIVSEPDIRTAQEAGAYLRKLHSILTYISVCDGNMEQGSFRCDANVSLRPVGQEEFGTRTELKNLNSFRNVERAILYEIERQGILLDQGKKIIQETRLWDSQKNITSSMRGKEDAHDYRYFPDPDLVPLIVDDVWIDRIRKEMPELPQARKARFISDYKLSEYDATILTATRGLADYFEHTIQGLANVKQAANWIITNLLGMLNNKSLEISQSPVTATALSELLLLLENGTINVNAVKLVFEKMMDSGKSAKQIVQEEGLEQVSDTGVLEAMVQEVISENPDEVAAYCGGKTKLISFFMGQVMKKSRGKADPQLLASLLKSKLSS